VQAVLSRFPGAEIVEVRAPAETPPVTIDEMPDLPQNESDTDA
jgi:hypothetical protein